MWRKQELAAPRLTVIVVTSEPTGPDPLAVIALVVAACSAVITLFGLVWQFTLYKLQGSRLKVEIAFGFLFEDGSTTVLRGRHRRAPTFERFHNRHQNRFYGIEYGLVRVTNIGRTPVSVENISFDVGREHWWKLGRKSITPIVFRDPEADNEAEFDTQVPHRVEAGANVTATFHLWPALASSELRSHRGKRKLVVRGTATAVGRRATRSSRRSAWRFRPGATSWFSDPGPPAPEIRVYRRLWLAQRFDYVGPLPVALRHEIIQQLREGASVTQVKDFLDELNPEGIHGIVAYDAHHAFHSAAATSTWPEDPIPDPPMTWRMRARRVLWGVQRDVEKTR